MVDPGHDCDILGVSESHMELSQKARLRGVTVWDDIIVALLFDELKNRELLAFAQYRLTLTGIGEICNTKVEVSAPSKGEGDFFENGPATIMHIQIWDLEIGTGRGLAHAVKTPRYLTSRLLLDLLPSRLL